MIEAMTILAMLLATHWVADYPLQGDFLATAKAQGPLRAYHLFAHAGIHTGAVLLVTGSLMLATAEFIAHSIIDENKTWGRISFATDQALHVSCKVLWAGALWWLGPLP